MFHHMCLKLEVGLKLLRAILTQVRVIDNNFQLVVGSRGLCNINGWYWLIWEGHRGDWHWLDGKIMKRFIIQELTDVDLPCLL